ncbi:MAG: hypothetical protein JNL51_03725 [Chitinophagaceae bacterium]|nr:hypothetical protein [Chitinophagaceae bacterium]
MVTATEIGQLSEECNLWRGALHSFRDQFTNYKDQLQKVAGRQTDKDILLEIERLENQFHIQLINIHDLKQAIKRHNLEIMHERAHKEHIHDDTLAAHENLYDDFHRLEGALHSIGEEFKRFMDYVN